MGDDSDRVVAVTVSAETDRIIDGQSSGKPSGSFLDHHCPKQPIARVLCSLGVIAVVGAVIVLMVLGLQRGDDMMNPFTLQDVFDPRFAPQSLSVQWLDFDRYVVDGTAPDGSSALFVVNAVTQNRTLWLRASQIGVNYTGWTALSDSRVLLYTDAAPIYRHSFSATYYYVLQPTDASTAPVVRPVLAAGTRLRLAQAAPSDALVACVVDAAAATAPPPGGRNNLLLWNASSGDWRVLTSDGSDAVLNGVPDWAYEEEVLESGTALWWAPDARRLAYLQTNISAEPLSSYPMYDQPPYAANVPYRYPKPGYPIGKVSVRVVDVLSGQTVPLNLVPFTGNDGNYVYQVLWESPVAVLVRWVPRRQTQSQLLRCSAIDGSCTALRTERASSGWVDVYAGVPIPLDDGTFIDMTVMGDNVALALYAHDGTLLRRLSAESESVSVVYGLSDAQRQIVYASNANGPTRRPLVATMLDGSARRVLTGGSVGWYDASVAPSCSSCAGLRYLEYRLGPDVPTVTLRSGADAAQLLIDNAALRRALSTRAMPTTRYIEVPLPGRTLNAMLVLPPAFTESRAYPVLMYNYGGPGSQMVTEQFALGFSAYIASSLNTIVATVDGRGTGGRGQAFLTQTYRRLGLLETEDVLDTGAYLGTLPFVDRTRMMLWGWSFGGYLTAMVLSNHSNVFTAGMSVAPVTDWRYYDAIYTERFMLQPAENTDGYDATSVITRAAGIKPNALFLVHGTADDNVQFMNSAALVARLIALGTPLEMAYYPDRNHGIRGAGARPHLYAALSSFVQRKLQVQPVGGSA